jgi:hypothetical protein
MAGGVEAPEPGDGSEKNACRTRGRVIPSRRRPSLSFVGKAGYSLRHFNSTLYLVCAPHRRQHRKRTNSCYPALCWRLLLTGTLPGGGQPCFSLYFLFSEPSPFSSPDTLPGGGGLFYFIFFVGTFSSPETLPEGGQLCFSSTLPGGQCARNQRAASLALSLSVSANALGHDQQCTGVNGAGRNVHREHVTVNGNPAAFGGQPATGNVFVREYGRQGLDVNVGGVLSGSTQTGLDLGIALVDSLRAPSLETLVKCGNLRSPRSCSLGRGYKYPFIILFFYFFTETA